MARPWHRQGCSRISVPEKLSIWEDRDDAGETVGGQATQGALVLGSDTPLCHVESPFIGRESDRLRIEGPEILHHDLSNSFLH